MVRGVKFFDRQSKSGHVIWTTLERREKNEDSLNEEGTQVQLVSLLQKL